MVEKSRGLGAAPVLGAFNKHHGVAVCRQERMDPCSPGEESSPAKVQMVQAGQFLAVLTRGWSNSKAVGDAIYGTQVLQCCQSLLPSLAGNSSFFGCILVFPILLLFPLWGEVSTCGEAEFTAWGASSVETQF